MKQTTNDILCIYHGNCADGFGAAWVIRKVFGGAVDFHAGFYGKEPPDVTGKTVYLVDFSFKRTVLLEMAKKAEDIFIFDHHKTAQADLVDLPENVHCVFDMTHSGAILTWLQFFPIEEPPELLEHIEDRDLWLFKLNSTREILASVFSYPYDFEVWDKLMITPKGVLIVEGSAIERKHHKDIAELVRVSKRRMKIGGYDVPVANLPYTLSSDAGHLMGKGEPFAACYMDDPSGRTFSLRSADDGVDVSEIARRYGGGGHAHAAGFKQPIGWEGEA